MGHCVNYIVADKDAERKSIIADICEEVYHESWEEGGSYHGNLKWHDNTVYDSEDDAYAAIDRLDRGRYDDHAVLFRDTSRLENAKTTKLAEQIATTKAKKVDYIDSNHVTARKSAYIGCPHCKSKLSREYLKRDACPLCGTDLRSDTVKERIKGYDAKIAELKKRLADEKKKLAAKAPVKWLVKYEYHI